jgi:hypothetical protein
MTGKELKAARHALGMSVVEFGRWLGYRGSDRNISAQIRRYERGNRPVPFDLTEADLRRAAEMSTASSVDRR